MPPGSEEIVEHGTQVRCANCATGWVTLDSQEDVPAVPYKKCEACRKTANSQRSERRAQDPKPRGQPLKKKSNRGRKPKSDLQRIFGNSLHVAAQQHEAGKQENDDDELATQPPASQPATRSWGRPPTQKSGGGVHGTIEPQLGPLTRQPTRHTRRGSHLELEPKPKRIRAAQGVTSSPDPLHLSNQQSESPAFSPQRFLNPPDEPPSSIDPLQQEERELSAAMRRKMSLSVDILDIPPSSADPLHREGSVFPDDSSTSRDATPASLRSVGSLLRQFLAPTAVQHDVAEMNEFARTTSSSQPSGEGWENEEREDSDEDREEEGEEESPTRRRRDPDLSLDNRVTQRSNRVTSRRRGRATNIDTSLNETPRRPLRSRSVRNPSGAPRATPAAAEEEKPKYYNSEFRKRDTQRHHLGERTIICPHCHAYMWKDELPAGGSLMDPSFEVCCKRGKIRMDRPITPFPALLRNLYLGNDPRSAEFLKNIRSYNAALAFTSCELRADNRLGNNPRYFPVSMQGQSVHRTGSTRMHDRDGARYGQIYFYDGEEAASIRNANNQNRLDEGLLRELDAMLRECNPYYRIYKNIREITQEYEAQHPDMRVGITPQFKLFLETGKDRKRENLPQTYEVAALIPNEWAEPCFRDVVVERRIGGSYDERLMRVSDQSPHYMPLHYVLLFPTGLGGYRWSDRLWNPDGTTGNKINKRDWYRYFLFERATDLDEYRFNPFPYARRLFQQYCIDVYAIIDQQDLEWIRNNQANLLREVLHGLTDHLGANDADPNMVGQKVILPSSYHAGDRAMQQAFQNACALRRVYGATSLFITFTANPKWPEIVDYMHGHGDAMDRPDIVTRVFHMKQRLLLEEIRGKGNQPGCFGRCIALTWTLEYQKRGLPHMHLLVWLAKDQAYLTPDLVDEWIRAEFPTQYDDPDQSARRVIERNMCHGPCGEQEEARQCMVKKKGSDEMECYAKYPFPFQETTQLCNDSWPLYRRRDNGQHYMKASRLHPDQAPFRYTNEWVVPHNLHICHRYNAHVNLHAAQSIKSPKYIFKYITKGHDKANAKIVNEKDEVERQLQCRYISPAQAVWAIMQYRDRANYPAVQQLALHLENAQNIVFDPEGDLQAQVDDARERQRTTLQGWFAYNQENVDGSHILYGDFPQHFSWDRTKKPYSWKPRTRGSATIGRIVAANIKEGERYYLRRMLLERPGMTCHDDFYVWGDRRYATYREACLAMALLEDNAEFIHCLEEQALYATGAAQRETFVYVLLFCGCHDANDLWERCKETLCDDLDYIMSREYNFPLPHPENVHYDLGLFLIEQSLRAGGRALKDFGLPEPQHPWARYSRDRVVHGVMNFNQDAEAERYAESYARLNLGQRDCFQTITEAVDLASVTPVETRPPHNAYFFVQGAAGTGKTTLYHTVSQYYHSKNQAVICVASSGIAALLLPGGRTSHSMFKIPIEIDSQSICGLKPRDEFIRTVLRRVTLIIWDEVPMQHQDCFAAVDRTFRDLLKVDALFAGIPVLFGGDFAQIPPVVPNGSKAETIMASIRNWVNWENFTVLHLTENMRLRGVTSLDNLRYAQYLARLSYTPELYGPISLPSYIQVYEDYERFYTTLFPSGVMIMARETPEIFADRAILASHNTSVAELNNDILKTMGGEAQTFTSVDSAEQGSEYEAFHMDDEYLHTLEASGIPPPRLTLKIGAPVMLMRNMNPANGFCNGTRCIVKRMHSRAIEVEISSGEFKGRCTTLPRILCNSKKSDFGFILTRRQFPLQLCFAISINKSQGQSLPQVGLDLRNSVFSHGQLYVALSRVTNVSKLHVLLRDQASRIVENIVWPELLLPQESAA